MDRAPNVQKVNCSGTKLRRCGLAAVHVKEPGRARAWVPRAQPGVHSGARPLTRCPAPVRTSGGSRPLPCTTLSKLPDSSIELECEESLSFDLSQVEAAGFKCLNGRGVEGKVEVLPGGAGALGAPEGKIRSGGMKL